MERYDRNMKLFGAEGQVKLSRTRVAVVGCGGLGLRIVQESSLLGVGALVAIDDEMIDETNRNRYVGVLETDPVPGTLKVDIACRLANSINRAVDITIIPDNIVAETALNALRDVDVVFGCVDDDGVRFILTQACLALDKPLIDMASDVPEPDVYGGRVALVLPGTGCLLCRGLLDPKDVAAYLRPGEHQEMIDAIYGVERGYLHTAGPSVAPLNGVIANLGAMEFMAHTTGLRPPNLHLEYLAHKGIVRRREITWDPDCYYCHTLRGCGEFRLPPEVVTMIYQRRTA